MPAVVKTKKFGAVSYAFYQDGIMAPLLSPLWANAGKRYENEYVLLVKAHQTFIEGYVLGDEACSEMITTVIKAKVTLTNITLTLTGLI